MVSRNLSQQAQGFLEYILLALLCCLIIVAPYFRFFSKVLLAGGIACLIVLTVLRHRGGFVGRLFPAHPLADSVLLFMLVCFVSVVASHSFYHSQKVFFNRHFFYLSAFLMGVSVARNIPRCGRWISIGCLVSGFIFATGSIRDIVLFNPTRLFTVFGFEIPFAMLPLFTAYFLPLNFGLWFFSEHAFIKRAAMFNTILLIPVFLWQGSRGAWVAIAFSLLILSFLKGRKVFWVSCAVVLFLALGSSISSPLTRAKISTIPQPSQWNYRTPLFAVAVDMFRSRPVIGVGLGMYEQLIKTPEFNLPESYPNRDHRLYLHAHNVYLEILAETGLLGLVAFISIFLSYFTVLYKRVRVINSSSQPLVYSFAAVIISTLVYGIAGSIITVGTNESYIFWLILGLSSGFLAQTQGEIWHRHSEAL